ncbi:MAG: hypothetical protein ACI9UV_002355 [Algoriphagus sp.]|jgi:hypothetical protein|tara:strand:+ start:88 stop:366 length:279 start_codon:yes stop_codon:yes gene_type:complete
MPIGFHICKKEINDEVYEEFGKKLKEYLMFRFGLIFIHSFRMFHFKTHLICYDLFGSKKLEVFNLTSPFPQKRSGKIKKISKAFDTSRINQT